MTPTLIDQERVQELLVICLFEDGEPTEPYVEVEGVMSTFRLHPERLESHRDEIKEMLNLLPLGFRSVDEGGGGGWSLLNGCVVADPDRPDAAVEELPIWTGFQMRVDQLFVLGMGLGLARYLLPRELWGALPGSMPYYVVTLDPTEAKT